VATKKSGGTKKSVKKAAPRGQAPKRAAGVARGAGAAAAAGRKKTPTKPVAKKALPKAAAPRVRKSAASVDLTPKVERKDPPSKRIALAIAEAALEKKAVNVMIIDVYGKVDYADYLVVMSGRSDRQVSALARGIAEDVQKATGERCEGIEGATEGSWVLMDFGDVVVHIFHDDVRGYYDLESLWIDAGRVPVPGQPAIA